MDVAASNPPKPTIGRIVLYRSRTGNYTVPAVVTATVDTLAEVGVELWRQDHDKGVPPLSGDDRVHLACLTPGKPGLRADAQDFEVESEHGRSENVGGTYQEWDIEPDHRDVPLEDQRPGTWRWPPRV